jgi:hypothetical protein
MNLNESYDWGMDMVKKLKLKYPYKATNILYGFIPRGTILLDDTEQRVVFNMDCMGIHYLPWMCAYFDYPEYKMMLLK